MAGTAPALLYTAVRLVPRIAPDRLLGAWLGKSLAQSLSVGAAPGHRPRTALQEASGDAESLTTSVGR